MRFLKKLLGIKELIQGNPDLLLSDETIYCDVDGTLAIWHLSPDHPKAIKFKFLGSDYNLVPHKQNIELVKQFHKEGKKIIIWSMAGETYAREVCKQLKLTKYAYDILSKPSVLIDDLQVSEIFRHSKHIYKQFEG